MKPKTTIRKLMDTLGVSGVLTLITDNLATKESASFPFSKKWKAFEQRIKRITKDVQVLEGQEKARARDGLE